MQKINYILPGILLAGALSLTACSDFLDLKPKGKEIPTDLEHYTGLLNNTMFMNMSFSEQNPNGSISPGAEPIHTIFMGDELTADSVSFGSLDRTALAAYKYEADIFNLDDNSAEWSGPYQQIYTYNVIANGVMDAETGTYEEKLKIQAEARVGRAYMHFLLAQYFGKPYHAATAASDLCVPIVTRANSSDRDYTRASVQKVYDFVINELEEACPQLEAQTKHRLRIYQAAGYYMLGKVHMAMGDYGKALAALQKAETATKNSTVSLGLFDYNTKLAEWGYKGLPFLWAMTGSYPMNFDVSNSEVICNKQINIMLLTFFAYPPTVYVKPGYMALYEPSDLRLAFFSDLDYTGDPKTRWPYFKRIQRMTYTLAGDMPDLCLMLAECKARTGDQNGAREDLLTLRQNRMPAADAPIPANIDNKDKLIRFVIDERKREFMMTGLRWFDIKRLWNDPLFQEDKANYTHSDGKHTYPLTEDRLVFRIPPKVLSFSPDWQNNK